MRSELIDGSASRDVLHSLNVLRGIAALAVLLLHSGQNIGVGLMPSAYLAVDVFFLLSGIVMAHAYGRRLSDGLTALAFMRIRLIRFYPLHILAILAGSVLTIMLGGALSLTSVQDVLVSALFASLFLPTPGGPSAYLFPLNPAAWSLFFELIVNAAFAALYRYLRAPFLLSIIAVSGIMLAAYISHGGSAIRGFTIGSFMLGLLRAVFSFYVGVLLYGFRAPNIKGPWAIIPLGVLLAIFMIDPGPWRTYYDVAVIFIVAPATVLFLYRCELPSRWVPIATFLGVASFGVYILQYSALLVARLLSSILSINITFAVAISATLLLMLCPLIDRYYDAPLRRALSSFRWTEFFRPRRV